MYIKACQKYCSSHTELYFCDIIVIVCTWQTTFCWSQSVNKEVVNNIYCVMLIYLISFWTKSQVAQLTELTGSCPTTEFQTKWSEYSWASEVSSVYTHPTSHFLLAFSQTWLLRVSHPSRLRMSCLNCIGKMASFGCLTLMTVIYIPVYENRKRHLFKNL